MSQTISFTEWTEEQSTPGLRFIEKPVPDGSGAVRVLQQQWRVFHHNGPASTVDMVWRDVPLEGA